ncbi:MAG: phosphotransferase family protein [Candidatus Hodarchaeota archaeon]
MFEETNPPDIDESIVLEAVRSCLPDISDPRIKFHYHGTYNVYLVEEEYLFRFPSSILPDSEKQRLVRREAALLERLKPHLTFEIPSPEFLNVESGYPFMGYKMISGASLTQYFESTSIKEQRFLGAQVGRFLTQLHAIDGQSLDIGEDGTYDSKDSHSEFIEVFERVQDLVYPNLEKNEIDWTDALFHDFLDFEENFNFEPVLIHGDFDTSNILVNTETFTITGILDFEETRVYDPATDFIFLSEGYEFLSSLLNTYSGRIDPRLGDRVLFRLGRAPFIYILWGTDNGLESMVAYGYSALRENILNWTKYTTIAQMCFSAQKP